MKTVKPFAGRQSILAVAVLAAIGQISTNARAEVSEEAKLLIEPESHVSIGAAGLSGNDKDRAQFGMFNGMRKDSSHLILDLDYLNRNNAEGIWTSLQGRNLRLDSRVVRVTWAPGGSATGR